MHDRSDLEIFVRAARAGSLTRAGTELGLSVAVVSKRIRRLEARLATRLLHRTTRHVSPTDLGAAFLERVAPLLEALADAEAHLSRDAARPRGTLRLTAPSSFGRLHVVPHLRDFFALHPDIELDLTLGDDFDRIAEGGFDLAIRIGALQDSGLTARRLAPVRRVLCASPGYLRTAGRPRVLADLDAHVRLATVNQNPWQLAGPDGLRTVPISGPLRTRSNEAVREAVIGGLGIGLRSTWDVAAELRSGALEIVLPDWVEAAPAGIYAVYPSRAFLPGKTRAFIDFLRPRFRALGEV
ncbi:MAG: LysR family transcriptional regulator [Gluconacetobacter diazotrophicus]|nr:LysR family transcriptional regulator [Gluconacetobacter diazotrophicus]